MIAQADASVKTCETLRAEDSKKKHYKINLKKNLSPADSVCADTDRNMNGGSSQCTVRVFRQKFTRGAIGSHACSLQANMRVTNGITLESSLLLPIATVNCVQTLKVTRRQQPLILTTVMERRLAHKWMTRSCGKQKHGNGTMTSVVQKALECAPHKNWLSGG
jgi:hypothetical protein